MEGPCGHARPGGCSVCQKTLVSLATAWSGSTKQGLVALRSYWDQKTFHVGAPAHPYKRGDNGTSRFPETEAPFSEPA